MVFKLGPSNKRPKIVTWFNSQQLQWARLLLLIFWKDKSRQWMHLGPINTLSHWNQKPRWPCFSLPEIFFYGHKNALAALSFAKLWFGATNIMVNGAIFSALPWIKFFLYVMCGSGDLICVSGKEEPACPQMYGPNFAPMDPKTVHTPNPYKDY